MKRRGNISYMLFLAVTAAVGGLLFGYDTAVISGTVELVTVRFGLDSLQQGWYVGCALAGSIAGVLCSGVLSDRLGRRRTMLVSAVLFTVSAAGCALCTDFTQLVVYRIVGGLGIGVVSVVSPLYISEVSAARRRGMLVSFYQLAVTMGFLAAYTVNYLLLRMGQTAGFETAWMRRIFVDEVWRGMLGAETLPALVFFVIIFFIPESPRWLVLRGHTDRALRVLGRINGDRTEAAAELGGHRNGRRWRSGPAVAAPAVQRHPDGGARRCGDRHSRTVHGRQCRALLRAVDFRAGRMVGQRLAVRPDTGRSGQYAYDGAGAGRSLTA